MAARPTAARPAGFGPGAAQAALAALAATAFAAAMLARPDLTLAAARQGAELWWNNVLPALLPFFVGGQLLLGLGVGSFLGVLLEPALRLVFALPGSAGLVVAMAAGSGYPFGAVLTARLYREGHLTRPEAERLLAVAATANPLFTGGTVASAMLGNPGLAGLLLAVHYLAALATGVLLRLLHPADAAGNGAAGNGRPGRSEAASGDAGSAPPAAHNERGTLLRTAWRALLRHRERDGRAGPEILAEAVEEAVRTLLLVGGFIILGAVLLRLLDAAGLLDAADSVLAPVLVAMGLPPAAGAGLLAGLLEITNGAQHLAAAPAPPLPRLAALSAVLGWGGLSVLAQVAAVTRGTRLRLGPFVAARALHATLAALLTVALYDPARHAIPAWLGPAAAPPGGAAAWLALLAAAGHLLALTVAGLAAASAVAATAALAGKRMRP